MVDEIRRLGRRFGILTEYTSFLIVEDNVDRARVDGARRAFQDVARDAPRLESGAGAVGLSQRAKSMQGGAYGMGGMGPAAAMPASEAAAPVQRVYLAAGIRSEEVTASVREAGEKTFYLRLGEGCWYDSLIPVGTTPRIDLEVTAWSDGFFELVRQYPDLSRYLRVGEKLVVQLGGKTVRISP